MFSVSVFFGGIDSTGIFSFREIQVVFARSSRPGRDVSSVVFTVSVDEHTAQLFS